MITNNKAKNNGSDGNIYQTFFNPSSSYNNKYNVQKRQRSKDSYVDIVQEKNNLICYEVIQINKNSKNGKLKAMNKTISCPKYENFNKGKKNQSSSKNSKKSTNQYSIEIKDIDLEEKSLNNIPIPNTLRDHYKNINNEIIKSLFQNNDINFNKDGNVIANRSKMNHKIGKLLNTGKRNNNSNSNNNNLSNEKNKIQDIIFSKVTIESYSYKNKKVISKNDLSRNNFNINNQNKILKNKENCINNDFDNLTFNINDNKLKKILNYEEAKNNEEENKNFGNNEIYKSLRKPKPYADNNKNIKKIKINNNKRDKQNNNKIKKSFMNSLSCPKDIHSKFKKRNNDYISLNILQNTFFKDKINNILKKDDNRFLKNKKYFKKNEEKKDNYNSNLARINDYGDSKLKKLLNNIPRHKKSIRNKKINYSTIVKEKTFNVYSNIIKKYINDVNSIMPPNNLKEIIHKKEKNFFEG